MIVEAYQIYCEPETNRKLFFIRQNKNDEKVYESLSLK